MSTLKVPPPMSPRTCVHCGAALPADAHRTRITCSRDCKEARYRRRQRERRPDRPPKRHPPPKRPPVNFDAVTARLRRERDVLDAWKNRR